MSYVLHVDSMTYKTMVLGVFLWSIVKPHMKAASIVNKAYIVEQ